MSAGVLDLGPLEVDEFAEFWAVYPRHKDRARAAVAYGRARRVATAAQILEAARAYAASVAGRPAAETRWAVEWLRAEPWRPEAPPVSPPAPTRRRRRADPSKPRRLRTTTSVRPLTATEQRDRWCREHGVTVAEYESRKGDKKWLDKIIRRGQVA